MIKQNHKTGIYGIYAGIIFFCFLLTGLMSCGSGDLGSPMSPIFKVPEGFTIEEVVSPELIDYPMFASFDDQGRLFVFEATEPNDMGTDSMLTNPRYQIRLLEDADGDGIFDHSSIFADHLPFPMGGTFHDGSLYAAATPDLLKLTDTDGDGKADKREVILTGWTLNQNGAILSGPFMGPDGWMYLADARRGFDIMTKEGKRLQGKGARIWRCLPDGSRLEWVSGGGFDNSIEIDFMPNGDPVGTMTYFRDPAEGERDALMHWVWGGVYPKPQAVIEQDSLVLTGDLMPVVTKLPRIAPSGIMRFRGSQWGEEYQSDWFSAIFNTGQILRHKMTIDGGTYTSEESAWLTPLVPDVHPTDVLQDGAGNLLVVVTGGWFIEGCPLSRVAKPEIKGGIYRIKKSNIKTPTDPWGKNIHPDNITGTEQEKWLYDERSPVRKKVIESLVKKGAESREILERAFLQNNFLPEKKDASLRLDALFALYRIQDKNTHETARLGFRDENPDIRTATARMAGLAIDTDAFTELTRLVKEDGNIMVRRQSATALGQLGMKEAVPVLIAATEGVTDRFLLHALRYSMIALKAPDLLWPSLTHPSPSVRESVLIVLDQLRSPLLSKHDIKIFLEDPDEQLRSAGIRVLEHHPEWSDLVVGYLRKITEENLIDPIREASLKELLMKFCSNSAVENFIAGQLNTGRLSDDQKIIFLEAMKQCESDTPKIWKESLTGILRNGSDEIKMKAVDIVNTRHINGLDAELDRLLNTKGQAPEMYMKIYTVKLNRQKSLSDRDFERILTWTDTSYLASVRRQAASLLNKAELSESQLMTITMQKLPEADAVIIKDLVECFRRDSTEKIGMALADALHDNTEILNTDGINLQGISLQYPESVQTALSPILESIQKLRDNRWSQLVETEKKLQKGDVGRGRNLFFGKATCSTCHTDTKTLIATQ